MNKQGKKLAAKKSVMTPEELAKLAAARAALVADAAAERERVELYGKNVEKMSHRQLRGELVRSIKREYTGKPPQPQAGLTIALSTVLLAVLDNTKIDPIAGDGRKLRLDQLSTATCRMNPGW